MNSLKTIVPHLESKKLLSLPTRRAEQLFQSYDKQQQLEILGATRNPKAREQLYYLVPDCTELIQASPTEDVLQVLDTMLGTGLASVLLPCLSNEQFEELMDIAVWCDGKLDKEALDLWLFELCECDSRDLGNFLRVMDIRLLAALLYRRIKLQDDYGGLLLESGFLDPASPALDYVDEQARALFYAIWEADQEIFEGLIAELCLIGSEGDIETELETIFKAAQVDRALRRTERDQQKGIDITEADLLETVDLETLTFDTDTEGKD